MAENKGSKKAAKEGKAEAGAAEQVAEKDGADETQPDNIAELEGTAVTLTVELGRTSMTIDEAVAKGENSLIELDKSVGEPVNVLINGRLFARGEVVVVDESFGVRVIEVVGQA